MYETTSLEYHIEDLSTATNYELKIMATYPEMVINADQGESFRNIKLNITYIYIHRPSLVMKESVPSPPLAVLTAPNPPSLDPILEVGHDSSWSS